MSGLVVCVNLSVPVRPRSALSLRVGELMRDTGFHSIWEQRQRGAGFGMQKELDRSGRAAETPRRA